MNPFTFSLLLMAQRVDDALQLERSRSRPDPYLGTFLRRRKRLLAKRLQRSLAPLLTESA